MTTNNTGKRVNIYLASDLVDWYDELQDGDKSEAICSLINQGRRARQSAILSLLTDEQRNDHLTELIDSCHFIVSNAVSLLSGKQRYKAKEIENLQLGYDCMRWRLQALTGDHTARNGTAD